MDGPGVEPMVVGSVQGSLYTWVRPTINPEDYALPTRSIERWDCSKLGHLHGPDGVGCVYCVEAVPA